MIIAGFAGVGKTTFCNNHKNAIDFVAMPFKYENLEEISNAHLGESIKAHPDLKLKTDWRYDYYDALIKTQERYPDEIIVIPTDFEIMNWLDNDDIPYILVYPNWAAEDVYKQRYIERGNSQDFIDLFIGNWDYWMEELTSRADANSIKLKSKQFLSDVIDVSDGNRIIEDKENYIDKIRRETSNLTSKDISVDNLNFIAVHKESGKRVEFNLLENLDTSDYEIFINRECYFDENEVGDICFDNCPDNEYCFRLKRPNENKTGLIKPMRILMAEAETDNQMIVMFHNSKVFKIDLSDFLLTKATAEKNFNFNEFEITETAVCWKNTKIKLSCYQIKHLIKSGKAIEIGKC